MTTTFENAKVGDRVYSLVHGWTEIYSIKPQSEYPIILKASGSSVLGSHTWDGSIYTGGDQVLFWDKPTIIAPERPQQAPPVDTLVEVFSVCGKWIKRYSAGKFDEYGNLMVWTFGASSHTAEGDDAIARYREWRLIGDNV